MNKILYIILFIGLSLDIASAQLISATIGINGLTCSQCSYSVEKSLSMVDFVATVKMDLNNPLAEVLFERNKNINLTTLADKVAEAGFSVRSFEVLINIDSTSATGSVDTFTIQNLRFNCVGCTSIHLGLHNYTLLGPKFMTFKTYKKWRGKLPNEDRSLSTKQYFIIP